MDSSFILDPPVLVFPSKVLIYQLIGYSIVAERKSDYVDIRLKYMLSTLKITVRKRRDPAILEHEELFEK